MKVAVDGYIIDTELIYAISPIRVVAGSFPEFTFDVMFYNQKKISFRKETTLYMNKTREGFYDIRFDYTDHKSSSLIVNMSLEDIQASDGYSIPLGKLTTIRERLIDIWTQNQNQLIQIP